MKLMPILLGFLAASTICGAVNAQAPEARDGPGLARRVCAECHAVERMEPRSPNARAPTFQELASARGMTATALAVALTTPHAGMPMFRLSDAQRADIIAYILNLR
jgi:mono/diheme cytochrome c family protein